MDEVAKEMLKEQRDKVFSMRAKLAEIEKTHRENLKIYKETDYSFTEELYHSGGMSKESWEQFKDAYEMLKMYVSMSPTMISNSRKMLAEEEAKLREMEKYCKNKKDNPRLEMLKTYLMFAVFLFAFIAVLLWICEIFGL